jgi:ATP-dependent Clp protease protease subunit
MQKTNKRETKKSLTDDIAEAASPGIALLFSEIDAEVAQDICTWILSENLSENPPEVLTLLINSPGGELSSAFAIIEIMNGSRIPVRTIVLGEACSAGLIIAMSGHKGMRIVTPTASIMSHSFSTSVAGSYHDIKDSQKSLNQASEMMIEHYKMCTGKPEKLIKTKLLSRSDNFMTAKEAIEFGLFDQISAPAQLTDLIFPIKENRQRKS